MHQAIDNSSTGKGCDGRTIGIKYIGTVWWYVIKLQDLAIVRCQPWVEAVCPPLPENKP